MKKPLLKLVLVLGAVVTTSTFAQAQKFGDNLGNHVATKDLQLSGKQILNASGIAIGSATITNGSVALKIGSTDKAIQVSAVATNADILTPENGMIIYNSATDKFNLYQKGSWTTFASGFSSAGAGIETNSNANGYTLTQVGQEMVLKLAPADASNPGIVTNGAQTFSGSKSFMGDLDLTTGAKLSVLNGAATLGGTVDVGGALTVGTSATPANSTFNGNVTTLGATEISGSASGASTLKITNVVDAVVSDQQSYLIVDANGNVKKGTFSNSSLTKYLVAIPVGASASFDPEGNSAIEITLAINNIKTNDAVIVNFSAADRMKFAGLSILSAIASADGQVTVNIADFRNPAIAGFAIPAIDAAKLIVTKYNAANN